MLVAVDGDALERLLRRFGQVVSRRRLLGCGFSRDDVDGAVRRGELVALLPSTYTRPWFVDDIAVRELAAVVRAGYPVAVSHTSALRRCGLPGWRPGDGVHFVVPAASRSPSPADGFTAHRLRTMPERIDRDPVPRVGVAEAVVAAWPMLPAVDRRAPAITAVRGRLTRADELRAAVGRAPNLSGRRELNSLLDLLAGGCESELEIWGHVHVFDVPGLRHAVRQRVIAVNGRRFRLDRAYEAERVAIELDGWIGHSSREQRERDMRRDALLATRGWVTLRFSHQRLHHDVAGCRRDAWATLQARRR